MSIYLTKTRDWLDSDGVNTEYKIGGEMREDILRRLLRPVEDLTSVWMIETMRSDGWVVQIFVNPFGGPNESVFAQDQPFEEKKDAHQNFFAWVFGNLTS